MQEFWVFGYGSLMWRPGFAFVERHPALLRGRHRSLCVYSHVHRGSPERPGLVLGLDRGGSCRGVAFLVPEADREETLAYLRAREQVTMVYREEIRTITLLGADRRAVGALCYVVDRDHSQYAGRLDLARRAELVRHGVGQSGTNPDYLGNTVRHLREIGIRDHELESLYAMVRAG
jgi:cation transport protein ChaC